MKKLLLLVGMAIGLVSMAQQTETDAVINAFKSGNANDIARYFDDYIDLKLLEREEVKNMSRNQAAISLKSFFDENKINGFEKGSTRGIGNSFYITGKLTSTGKPYNISVMTKAKDGKHQIITIRIN